MTDFSALLSKHYPVPSEGVYSICPTCHTAWDPQVGGCDGLYDLRQVMTALGAVETYADFCAITRTEPSTSGLRRALGRAPVGGADCASDVWQTNTDRMVLTCVQHRDIASWDIASETVTVEMLVRAWGDHLEKS